MWDHIKFLWKLYPLGLLLRCVRQDWRSAWLGSKCSLLVWVLHWGLSSVSCRIEDFPLCLAGATHISGIAIPSNPLGVFIPSLHWDSSLGMWVYHYSLCYHCATQGWLPMSEQCSLPLYPSLSLHPSLLSALCPLVSSCQTLMSISSTRQVQWAVPGLPSLCCTQKLCLDSKLMTLGSPYFFPVSQGSVFFIVLHCALKTCLYFLHI